MESFNRIVTYLFSLALTPFQGAAAIWGLLAVSIVAGILLVYIYGLISNQAALKRVKKRITAGIYESVLFRHDLPTSLKAQAGMLLGGVRYFALAIPPILVLLIPSLVILAQLNLRYGARALNTGEHAIVTVELNSEDALFSTELTSAEKGLQITPPLRDLDAQSVSWRVDTLKKPHLGEQLNPSSISPDPVLTLTVNGAQADQQLFTLSQPSILPTAKHNSPWLQLLYPGGSVPTNLRSQVSAITIAYPEQQISVAGITINWLLLFLLVSIISGLVASKLVGIEV